MLQEPHKNFLYLKLMVWHLKSQIDHLVERRLPLILESSWKLGQLQFWFVPLFQNDQEALQLLRRLKNNHLIHLFRVRVRNLVFYWLIISLQFPFSLHLTHNCQCFQSFLEPKLKRDPPLSCYYISILHLKWLWSSRRLVVQNSHQGLNLLSLQGFLEQDFVQCENLSPYFHSLQKNSCLPWSH